MGKTARHHHYISQCYLRGFTKSGGSKSKLTVFDLKNSKKFVTNPRNVCGIRDFNRINVEGLEPDIIEKGSLSNFETQVSSSLRNIEKTLHFEGEDKDTILKFIAMLAVRSPHEREQTNNFLKEISDFIMNHILSSKQRWESEIIQIKSERAKFDDYNITYEKMLDLQKRNAFKIRGTNEFHIWSENTMVNNLQPWLSLRKWLLISTTDDAGPFCTTDRPVTLTYIEPEKIPRLMGNSPGYGLRNTRIIFPLSRNLVLVGEFDGREGNIIGTEKLIAQLNSTMIIYAFQYTYSSKTSFKFMGKNHQILDGANLLSFFSS